MNSKKRSFRSGFTLVEILVVLVIMGFLVAMVAPKLAGVVNDAVDTTSDGGHKSLANIMQDYAVKNGVLPAGLTNMVYILNDFNATATSAQTAAIPAPTNKLSADGIEDLSIEFDQRVLPTLHYANKAETKEMMQKLGMRTVSMYATTGAAGAVQLGAGNKNAWGQLSFSVMPQTGIDGTLKEKGEWEGLFTSPTDLGVDYFPVMMVGIGMDGAGTAHVAHTAPSLTVDASTAAVTEDSAAPVTVVSATATYGGNDGNTFAKIGDARTIGRIVMGLNNGNGLVQAGLLEEAGVSAKQSQDKMYKWGNYLVLLPRLQASIDRFAAEATINGKNTSTTDTKKGLTVAAIGLDENGKLIKRTPGDPSSGYNGVNLEPQGVENVMIIDPEGKTWGNPNAWMGASILASSKGVSIK